MAERGSRSHLRLCVGLGLVLALELGVAAWRYESTDRHVERVLSRSGDERIASLLRVLRRDDGEALGANVFEAALRGGDPDLASFALRVAAERKRYRKQSEPFVEALPPEVRSRMELLSRGEKSRAELAAALSGSWPEERRSWPEGGAPR